jgi:Lon protease-like protein
VSGRGRGRSRAVPAELPLFPLRTVLFPGGLLPLKVFEARYVDMAKTCLAEEAPFGVCLLTRGDEVARPGSAAPEFAQVGTLARIVDWDMPELGILHIVTLGDTRFRVTAHHTTPAGLVVGDIVTIGAEPAIALPPGHEALARLLELIATRLGPENFPAERHYEDASWVGYRLAELLPLPLSVKQSMLEINEPAVRLAVLHQFLQQQGVL